MSAEPLTLEETLAMAEKMADLAAKDASLEEVEGFWCGWEGALRTLLQHQRTGVKVTCFPMGSCSCHPVKVHTK
jgi:hypothetical protein